DRWLSLFALRFAGARPSRRRSPDQHRSAFQRGCGFVGKTAVRSSGVPTYRRYVCGSTCFSIKQPLALVRTVVVIDSITRPEPRVYQPDPPGLIHDDLRLLPPWRGSSLLWGKKLSPPLAPGPGFLALRDCAIDALVARWPRRLCAHSRLSPQIPL